MISSYFSTPTHGFIFQDAQKCNNFIIDLGEMTNESSAKSIARLSPALQILCSYLEKVVALLPRYSKCNKIRNVRYCNALL